MLARGLCLRVSGDCGGCGGGTYRAHELKRVVSHVVEVEWEKFTRFFFLPERAVLKKNATFNGLKSSPSSR